MNKQQRDDELALVVDMQSRVGSLSPADKQELLRLKCRTDFITFAKIITDMQFKAYPVHELICSYLQNIGDGNPEYKRSAISLPPRTGKSMLISRIFPAWQLGRSPTAQFIMSSYALGLSTENSRAVLDFITSEKFSWIFPECDINKEKCNLTALRSENGGLIKIASAGSSVTGFGYGVIADDDLPGIGILDDLLADGNSLTIMESTFGWVQAQFLTRGLPNHAIISMGTRFHCDDVIGRLLNADRDNWKELNVPALCVDEEFDALGRKLGESHWPEFFPVENLIAIKKSIGERDFNSLYQGQPAGDAGAIFKEHWLETFDKQQRYSYVYATIDTAYKADSMNDFTAICVWGLAKDKSLKLIHVVMERMEFPDLQKLIPKIIKQWKIRCVYIEGRASGVPLIQSLKSSLAIQIKEIIPSKDKVLRANSVAPIVEEGLVSIYENIPNLQSRLNELTSFPFIKNDDFVDAFVYGVTVYRDELMGGKTSSGGIRTSLPKLAYDSSPIHTTSRKSANLHSLLGDKRNTRNAGGVRYL